MLIDSFNSDWNSVDDLLEFTEQLFEGVNFVTIEAASIEINIKIFIAKVKHFLNFKILKHLTTDEVVKKKDLKMIIATSLDFLCLKSPIQSDQLEAFSLENPFSNLQLRT